MVVLAVIEVAHFLELDSLMDRAKGTSAEEALFEEFRRWGEVAWVLLVTEVAGLLRSSRGEWSRVDFWCQGSTFVAMDCGWETRAGCAGLVDFDGRRSKSCHVVLVRSHRTGIYFVFLSSGHATVEL